ncbi:hypothetical protein OIC43_37060 [Streptomyces sp. NBC_00825]|uniref:hypothetical protein n=1 Tax=unclassified Streptomyces TaxID=2593676 RepID=UPI002ED1E256|nr:hypothetical protein OG832_06630 [Streptomyces sp. NBC_00826]WTH94247.1 hypothetical protein OIC43_37060 [Streptomyces sp. NBC_00825]WTI02982.1 hypothetical protein OHA23_37040 [Streptomyces sp. NBC_00822]
MAMTCAAAAARFDSTPCDGDPVLVVRFKPTDFGGTMGCPRHAALLRDEHPGSAIVGIQETVQAMSMFYQHPDLAELDAQNGDEG